MGLVSNKFAACTRKDCAWYCMACKGACFRSMYFTMQDEPLLVSVVLLAEYLIKFIIPVTLRGKDRKRIQSICWQ